MARYFLTKEFVRLSESAGTIVNISNVKVEISETARGGTGVILYPSRKMSFSKRLYAARAPSDCGVAVIGVLPGEGNDIDDGLENLFDDKVSTAEIDKLFGEDVTVPVQTGNETVTDADWQSIFGGGTNSQDEDDEKITDADWQKLFGR